MISIGNMAKMYGLLPSEVVERGSTFDLMVTDVLATWENHRADPAQTENYNPEQLSEILKGTR
jgi:hypothetical protein